MLYRGKIEELNKLVVSDPWYGENVWCRYENKQPIEARNWLVQMSVKDVSEQFDFDGDTITATGIAFSVLMTDTARCGGSALHDDDSFSYPAGLQLKEFTIGMDTACVAIGANEIADAIKNSRDEPRPSFALETLTDGEFGNVYEGTDKNGKVALLFVSGYLDEDTGYSKEDIVQYLSTALKVKDLELVQGKLSDRITKASERKTPQTNKGDGGPVPERG